MSRSQINKEAGCRKRNTILFQSTLNFIIMLLFLERRNTHADVFLFRILSLKYSDKHSAAK
jgi:hypothetical protein